MASLGLFKGLLIQAASGKGCGRGCFAFKAAGVKIIRVVECLLSMIQDNVGMAVMDGLWGQHGDAGMFVLLVIPREESLAVGTCILD